MILAHVAGQMVKVIMSFGGLAAFLSRSKLGIECLHCTKLLWAVRTTTRPSAAPAMHRKASCLSTISSNQKSSNLQYSQDM